MMKTACLLMFVLLICTGCPDRDFGSNRSLTVENKTDVKLVSILAFRSVMDTLLPSPNPYPTLEQLERNTVDGRSSKAFNDAYKEIFEQQDNKVLMLYLISRDTVEQVPWDSIISDYKVLRRYDLSLSDLESRGWKVEYP